MTELTDRLRFEQAEGYMICGEAADEIEHLALDLQTERAAVVALRAEMETLYRYAFNSNIRKVNT